MPRAKAAPKPEPKAAEDPLADLREDDQARYPIQDGQEGPQEGVEAPGEGDPLATYLLERLEAAMAIPLDEDGVITAEHRQMAQALATETADELAPRLETPPQTWEQVVEVWHGSTVALGFLHRGGRCGCRFIAQLIVGGE